jgi:hypothetical protein
MIPGPENGWYGKEVKVVLWVRVGSDGLPEAATYDHDTAEGWRWEIKRSRDAMAQYVAEQDAEALKAEALEYLESLERTGFREDPTLLETLRDIVRSPMV